MAAGQAPDRVLLLGSVTVTAAGVLTVTGVQTSGAVSQPLNLQAEGELTIYLRGIGTISSGTIIIEEADWDPREHPYSGTWSTMQTITASTLSGNVQQGIHFADTSYAYVRVRIGNTIDAGSIMAVKRSRGAM